MEKKKQVTEGIELRKQFMIWKIMLNKSMEIKSKNKT